MKKFRESHLKIVSLLVVRRPSVRRPSWSSKIFVHSRRPNSRARSYARPSACLARLPSAASLRSKKYLKLASLTQNEIHCQNHMILTIIRVNTTFSNRQESTFFYLSYKNKVKLISSKALFLTR